MRSRFPKRLQKRAKWGFKGYPLGTVAFYGPDNRFASKVAVAVIPTGGGGQLIELKWAITCPNCGHKTEEAMPTDACQYFFDCPNCASVLKPKAGDCCVFCSYGTRTLPASAGGEKHGQEP